MEKLPISIGILSWRSGQTLVNTLQTYFDNNFLKTKPTIKVSTKKRYSFSVLSKNIVSRIRSVILY